MTDKYDVLVIGAGPGGYVAAIRAAQLGLKTACVDKNKGLGGTCLNVGCIPSKTLLHCSEFYSKILHSSESCGVDVGDVKLNFEKMMSKKDGVVKSFNQGVSGLFKKNKIKSFLGSARLTSASTVEVTDNAGNKTVLEAKHIILATGSAPTPLPFLGFDEKRVLSSTGALNLSEVPQKMIIVGAGVIGLELGSVYSRLGTSVVVVEYMDSVCPNMDSSIKSALQQALTKQGISFLLGHSVTRGKVGEDSVSLIVSQKGQDQTTLLTADRVLVSIGRRPFTENLGLEEVGVVKDERGFVQIDNNFQTSVPGVYAIGDIVDGPMLAHKASEEGVAVVELISGKKPHINYLAIPFVVYTWPEVASVGMTEEEAKADGLSVKIGKFPFKANSRARCVDDDEGFVKVIAENSTGRLIGMHIIGANASELINQGMVAIEKKTTVEEMGDFPFAHPTLSEATKEACLNISKKAIHM
ncbi:MAG: dihydrolipoamide dehydrogenase [Chlamydiales bacterium]|jgi:dihydrolipoamide dehydrogenase